jgi:hypothetical protein
LKRERNVVRGSVAKQIVSRGGRQRFEDANIHPYTRTHKHPYIYIEHTNAFLEEGGDINAENKESEQDTASGTKRNGIQAEACKYFLTG